MSLDDLVVQPPSRLVWNTEPDAHWFHYTTPAYARAIYESGAFIVGKKAGFFVTDIQPGEKVGDQLLNALFDSDRDLERTYGVVVFRRDCGIDFERIDVRAYCHSEQEGIEIDVRESVVGWGALVSDQWRFHPGLYSA